VDAARLALDPPARPLRTYIQRDSEKLFFKRTILESFNVILTRVCRVVLSAFLSPLQGSLRSQCEPVCHSQSKNLLSELLLW
jgi:hypothetical protein